MITAQQTLYTKMFVPRQTPREVAEVPGEKLINHCHPNPALGGANDAQLKLSLE